MGLSLKLGLLSATVVSTAVMFNLLSPFITNLAISDLPIIWTTLTSWLRPPYLYVIINFIIITIVASSRLQSSKIDGSDHSLSTYSSPAEPVKVVHAAELVPPINHESVDIAPRFNHETLDEDMKVAKEAYEEIKMNRVVVVNRSVISMSAWTPPDVNQATLSFPVEKPQVSARFSHRKPAKATPEGGKTLGVAKPKRQDTLESTWKAINEVRSIPLTKHLRKSDTWETHSNRNSKEFLTETHSEKMTKSETFDVHRRNAVKPPPPPSKLRRSGGSGRLKKEPSLGQEELNRRVEAFIKKFNEDMRLQRQESLNQYMEMINRGAH
ncbi:hypothetical protein L1987_85013 [Smallanthus sonchifolius]|uniref:Uncharacterized protein n=1 Tax=Smallanthus sonchifolius TaxID=185202 RepID=A0ACB8XW02_9ASTR|nr:hypothetical protein L1987_85013 [Smallanthus sonchifolius]